MLAASLLLAAQVAGAQAPAPEPSTDGAPVTCESKNPSPETTVSLDTKGADFVPWARRFVQAVKRNWFVPDEALTRRGCVILSVKLLKDGTVAEVTAKNPSAVVAFTEAAMKALRATKYEPLPAAYSDDSVVIIGTFFYNETPKTGLPAGNP